MNMNNLEDKYDDLQTMLVSSKRYEMNDDGILMVQNYNTGDVIRLDLKKLDLDTFKQLYYEPEKEKDDYEI